MTLQEVEVEAEADSPKVDSKYNLTCKQLAYSYKVQFFHAHS